MQAYAQEGAAFGSKTFVCRSGMCAAGYWSLHAAQFPRDGSAPAARITIKHSSHLWRFTFIFSVAIPSASASAPQALIGSSRHR